MLRLDRTLLTNTPFLSSRQVLGISFRPKLACLAALLMVTVVGSVMAETITINGSQTYQVIDGFGVNANHRSWDTNELPAALDALIDQAGMTLFNVIFDNNNWEAANDNSDPNNMNWAYYNGVYSAPDFQKFWGIMAYLNQRGITNGLVPFLQGPVALWMGGLALTPGYENEYAETIASLLVYARNTQHLRFSVVGPVNEPDNTYAGIHLSGADQYVTVMHDLAQQLDNNGLSDVRFSGPELAFTSTNWLGAMMSDPLVMAKLDHFGLHSYLGASPDAAGVYDFIQQSAYPDRHFWMTEFNVWCNSCQASQGGDNSWAYARGTATCLLNHLANGASAGLVWEGYDSQYTDFNPTTGGNDPPHWSYWGLLAVDDINAAVKTYTPRKGFYTVAQVARFVRPGTQRIDASGASAPLTVLAFYNTNNGEFTLTGVNTNSSPMTLSGTLTNLPAMGSLELYYTDSTTNLFRADTVPITNGSFTVFVPADCVFTLATTNPPLPPPSVTVTIDGSRTYQVIDGFGVNANHRSWNNNELQPVLDALIDQAGMTLFRVVFDKADWEAANDNSDPNVMNWNYYNQVYSSPDFQKMWDMATYLNYRGITDGMMFNFQGIGPEWMGGDTLTPGYEAEWAEMVGSALTFARNARYLQFSLVGPGNEVDHHPPQGIGMTAEQYVTGLNRLSELLDANGLSDVRFVGPDLAFTSTDWLSAMMDDPAVMAKVGHFGLHSYQDNGGGSQGIYSFLQASAYPDRTYWMTEFNVWCTSCEDSQGGTNSWDYASGAARYLLYHLAYGASAGLVWEAYDSQYNYYAPGQWSYWGLFAVDNINTVPRTYTPRKIFYTLAQITKFVRPGTQQIDVSGTDTPWPVLAFYNTNNGQFTLTGVNTNASPTTLSGTMTNLPTLGSLELYYTDSTNNLLDGGAVPVTNGSFTVSVPADCVFTLAATNSPVPEPTPPPTFSFGPPLTPVWDVSGIYRITNHAQGAKLRPMEIVFDDIILSVDAKGKVRGAGTIVTYASDDHVGGDYKVSGKVSGGGSKTQVKFTVKFKGSGIVGDVSTTCKVNARYNLTVLPAAQAMAGKVTGNVRFSNLGNGDLKSEIALPLPPGVDGGWNVYLDIYPVGAKLSGNGLVLVNNQPSRILATRATGSVPKNSATAKVKLTGYGYSRGTRVNLQFVPISETTRLLQTVKGKVLGQNVKNGS